MRAVLCVFLLAFSAYAGNVKTAGVSAGDAATRDLQLREFGMVFHPQTYGYLGANLLYFPLPVQTKLSTEYGKHEGYVLRQNFAAYFADSLGKSPWQLGVLWWFERHGWDSEDFLLFPHYGDFSLIRSVQTAGVTLSRPDLGWGIAGGIQYSNPEFVGRGYEAETDSLFEWAAFTWSSFSVQTSFHHPRFRHARLSLNLESQQVLGGHSSRPCTYLPNIDIALYDRNGDSNDSLRLSWEQNLIAQRLYAEVLVYFPDKALRSVSLKYYPDPSKIVSFDVTCYRKPGGDLLWGGGITMPFIRVAYNHADDIENVFGLRGTWIVQFHLGIEKILDKFVGLNGSRSTPMMTRSIDTDESLKKQRREEREKTLRSSDGLSSRTKEITAKGIVVEEAK